MSDIISEKSDTLSHGLVEDQELREIVESRATEMQLAVEVQLDDL